VEHAVDAQPDDEGIILRIEMQVARAVLGRLKDDRVDEADERRVGDAIVRFEVVGVFAFLLDELVLDERRALPGLRGADDAAELELDVLRGGDPDLERVPGRDP
jgi:hypothetical protein